ncbi:hypothetical protein AX774_g6021 [Zancudomyces culisetae]|uniref:Uncharacterized protein n=1 Tax=Zancudomyces culisetae TaxID=1213189 RepID=A0A1R1PHV1_ZANCU|nr:hypothetical protein AX774_g7652 [Zancudomyces culisetae]OMH80527.1 hypothetical protein AX774_g6021 [Zancudomyces culisetae]|eukprot:OMH78949.1 hypothetical protein AX774_g7652 [Zancudomyces culisetae]
MGQELTIRTHHRGVVRKRLVPVLLGEDGDFYQRPEIVVDRSKDYESILSSQADIVKEIYPKKRDPENLKLSNDSAQTTGSTYHFNTSLHVNRVKDAAVDPNSSTENIEKPVARRRTMVAPGKLVTSIYNIGLALMRVELVREYDSRIVTGYDGRDGNCEPTNAGGNSADSGDKSSHELPKLMIRCNEGSDNNSKPTGGSEVSKSPSNKLLYVFPWIPKWLKV